MACVFSNFKALPDKAIAGVVEFFVWVFYTLCMDAVECSSTIYDISIFMFDWVFMETRCMPMQQGYRMASLAY